MVAASVINVQTENRLGCIDYVFTMKTNTIEFCNVAWLLRSGCYCLARYLCLLAAYKSLDWPDFIHCLTLGNVQWLIFITKTLSCFISMIQPDICIY